MAEIIVSVIANSIQYVYMIAVIAFVALQFGWIKKPNFSSNTTSSSQEVVKSSNDDAGKPDFSNMMQGLFGQMAPMIEKMTNPQSKPGSIKNDQSNDQSNDKMTPVETESSVEDIQPERKKVILN